MGSNPVNGNGAFGDEMNEVALFTDALRAAVPTQPDPRLTATLVPRLASTARTATLEAETRQTRRAAPTAGLARRPRSRRALVARVGIAVALIPLVLAGLAVAGVTVPAPARSAFDSIGIDLPNQPSKDDGQTGGPSSQPSTETTTTDETTTPSTEAKGEDGAQNQGKSEAAHENARSQRDKAKGKALGHDRGKGIGLNEATPPGQTGETGPPPHSNAGGNGRGASKGNPFPKAPKAPKAPKTSDAPKGVAEGHNKIPPGQAKKE
jgi:hypothetical protein